MEMIVVLTIVALLTAAVIPIYQGSLTWARSDRATRDVVALMKYAQERAVTDMTEYRFCMDYDSGAYWLERLSRIEDGDKLFEAAGQPDGGQGLLPQHISFQGSRARLDRRSDAHYVAFYSTGACDYATVKLDREEDTTVVIKTKGRLGQFEVNET